MRENLYRASSDKDDNTNDLRNESAVRLPKRMDFKCYLSHAGLDQPPRYDITYMANIQIKVHMQLRKNQA